MSEAIRILMDEHRLIERVLDALEAFASRLDGLDAASQRGSLAEFARFFRDYADGLHHAKEEDRLFVAMVSHGFPRESGPIAVMLHEHDLGREHVRSLASAGKDTGSLSPEAVASVRHHAFSFAGLLRAHIQKEDEILYPMAERAIPGDEMARLGDEFGPSGAGAPGGETAPLADLAERLIARYGPGDPRAS